MAVAVTEGQFRKSYIVKRALLLTCLRAKRGAENREEAGLYQSRMLKSKRLSADKVLARFLSRYPHLKFPRPFTP